MSIPPIIFKVVAFTGLFYVFYLYAKLTEYLVALNKRVLTCLNTLKEFNEANLVNDSITSLFQNETNLKGQKTRVEKYKSIRKHELEELKVKRTETIAEFEKYLAESNIAYCIRYYLITFSVLMLLWFIWWYFTPAQNIAYGIDGVPTWFLIQYFCQTNATAFVVISIIAIFYCRSHFNGIKDRVYKIEKKLYGYWWYF